MRFFLMVITLLAMTSLSAANPAMPQMTVSGEGRVTVEPDMATVRLGVVTEARGARQAIDENSRAMADVLERLAGLGIEARDLQTADFSVQPRWSRTETGGRSQIEGFSARNLLVVRVRDLARLGDVLDAVASDGANAFDAIQFGLSDPAPLHAKARRAAVDDAKAKAELYADAAGVALGPLISLSEAGGTRPPMPVARAEMAMASDAVPVAAGELTVSARVTLVYEMGPAE
ncbi:MAG: SIMPL domain-containing protein [Pseudomonadota bacterium]